MEDKYASPNQSENEETSTLQNQPRSSLKILLAKNTIVRSFRILDSKERQKLVLVGLAQTLLGFLDLIGVAIIGVVGAVAVKGIQSQSPNTSILEILDFLAVNNLSFQTQVAILGILAALILVARSLLTMYIARKILFFLSYKSASISSRLIRELLSRDISSLQRKSSQESLFAATTGVSILMLNVTGTAISIFADTFLLSILSIGLFVYDPLMAVSTLFLFGIVSLILYFATQKNAKKLGQLSSAISIASNIKILEVIHSFREIYTHDLQQSYAQSISDTRFELADSSAKLSFIPNVSKYVIEITLVVGGVGISAIQFLIHDSIQAIATLAIFLAAASRIAPAILRLQSGSIAIKSNIGIAQSTLEMIEFLTPMRHLNMEPKKLDTEHFGFIPSLSIQGASYTYPGSPFPSIDSVSIEIIPGQQVAIVGSSGAGKSTLIDLMLGLRELSSGEVHIAGMNPIETVKHWPGAISFVPQQSFISDSTIIQNVAFGYSDIDEGLVWEALEAAQLGNYVRSLSDGIWSKVGENGSKLSGGERQRLGIARALYTKPKFLILDEATSSLDAQTEVAISEAISKLRGKVTILMVAHRLSSVKNSDQVVYLENGKIISRGSFEAVKASVPDFDIQAKLMGL
jgi:ABC-type multidrug transport system fused ATPase/permease subunit